MTTRTTKRTKRNHQETTRPGDPLRLPGYRQETTTTRRPNCLMTGFTGRDKRAAGDTLASQDLCQPPSALMLTPCFLAGFRGTAQRPKCGQRIEIYISVAFRGTRPHGSCVSSIPRHSGSSVPGAATLTSTLSQSVACTWEYSTLNSRILFIRTPK